MCARCSGSPVAEIEFVAPGPRTNSQPVIRQHGWTPSITRQAPRRLAPIRSSIQESVRVPRAAQVHGTCRGGWVRNSTGGNNIESDRARAYQEQIAHRRALWDYNVTCGKTGVNFDGYKKRGRVGVLLEAKHWQPRGTVPYRMQRFLDGKSDYKEAKEIFEKTVGTLNRQAEVARMALLDLEWHFAFAEARNMFIELSLRAGWRTSGPDFSGRWVDLTREDKRTNKQLRVRMFHTPFDPSRTARGKQHP